MQRRSFIGMLLAMPVVAAAAVKSRATEPSDTAFAQRITSLDPRLPNSSWPVRLDKYGYVVGLQPDSMPVFAVKTVEGHPRVVVRDDFIDHLHGLAARQNTNPD